MKFFASIFYSFLFAANVFAGIPRGWNTNFDEALSNSAHRPVLAFFTASWCSPCKLMTATTLTDPLIFSALDEVEHVGVDIDEQREIAEKYEIEAVPTFVVFTPSGHEVDRITGYRNVGDFFEWLTNSITAAQVAEAEQKRMEIQLNMVMQLAQAGNINSISQGVAGLLDLFADADAPMQKIITAQLSSITAQHPALLLDGLNHPRLAARICAANLLRARLGNTFNIDPWSDAATRAKAVAEWRKK